jgi:tetratricopeptide (TPR) repeat protein
MAAAAAAAIILPFLLLKSHLVRKATSPAEQNRSQQIVPFAHLRPTLAFSSSGEQPILLARGLQPARQQGALSFRSLVSETRQPRPAGSIVSIEQDSGTIDLGSLDGVAKGNTLRVFRDDRSTQPLGRLLITTVFRERARGRFLGTPDLRIGYRVRVANVAFLGALWQQVDAWSASGNPGGALTMAEKALEWAKTENVSPNARAEAFRRLAALEFLAGRSEAAEKHYQSAVESLKGLANGSANAHAAALNDLAVLQLLRGDHVSSEALLRQLTSTSPITASLRASGTNNLGVLAELRGKRQEAQQLYTRALETALPGQKLLEQERRAIEANLARLARTR